MILELTEEQEAIIGFIISAGKSVLIIEKEVFVFRTWTPAEERVNAHTIQGAQKINKLLNSTQLHNTSFSDVNAKKHSIS